MNQSEIYNPAPSAPLFLSYIQSPLHIEDIGNQDIIHQNKSVDSLIEIITGIQKDTPIRLDDFLVDSYNNLAANRKDLGKKEIGELAKEYHRQCIYEYISWIQERFSKFQVLFMRNSYGKGEKGKQALGYKLAQIERRIQYFCNQLQTSLIQLRIPVTSSNIIIHSLYQTVFTRIRALLENKEDSSTKLLH